jgi:hypothetical protein
MLLDVAAEEGVGHAELMRWPVLQCNQREHRADRGRIYDRGERLAEVGPGSLMEAAHDPACLVPCQGAVRVAFVGENPLAGDDPSIAWLRNKRPS